jgi:hypothetical protein
MSLPPAHNAENDSRDDYNPRQDVKNLPAPSNEPFKEPVGEQHGGVAKPIVFQLAGALLILCQLFSSCK